MGSPAVDPERASNSGPRWPEIDRLRGLAVWCMAVNHSGLAWASDPSDPILSAIVFVGSFAPVLFFFTTGVGMGLASVRRGAGSLGDVTAKAVLLMMADWLLHPRHWGWDFLAFIGMSMLALHVVARTRRPTLVALATAALLLLIRFGGAAATRVDLDHPPLSMALGTLSIPGVSYWFAPWLCYPMLGFAIGRAVAPHRDAQRARALPALAVAGILTIGLSLGMAALGMPVFRWGTVSLAFWVASLGCLAVSMLIAIINARWVHRWVAIGGVASFAAVPIHYALVKLVAPHIPGGAALVTIGVVVFGFVIIALSKQMELGLSAWAPKLTRSGAIAALIAVVAIGVSPFWLPAFWLPSAMTVGQLLVCLLLAKRISQRSGVTVA